MEFSGEEMSSVTDSLHDEIGYKRVFFGYSQSMSFTSKRLGPKHPSARSMTMVIRILIRRNILGKGRNGTRTCPERTWRRKFKERVSLNSEGSFNP